MKKTLYIVFVVLVVSACSGPKYTASFNNYDKLNQTLTEPKMIAQSVIKPVTITQPEPLLASTSSASVELNATPVEEVHKTYIQMTKTERKALRAHLRSEIKTYVKEQKKNLGVVSTQENAAMDSDLKLASIFGAVGIVGVIIGGDVFYVIGVIALIIGVVFLVKWLVRQ